MTYLQTLPDQHSTTITITPDYRSFSSTSESRQPPWKLPALTDRLRVAVQQALAKTARSVALAMADELESVPAAKRVTVLVSDGTHTVWVEGTQLSLEERFAIYDAEWRLMQTKPDLEFDFHVQDLRDGPLQDLLGDSGTRQCAEVEVRHGA